MTKRRNAQQLKTFLCGLAQVAIVNVKSAKGSTPREEDAWMLVSHHATFGTIGGGELEFMAIDQCRQYLTLNKVETAELSIPLGPEIGQCCGGHVTLKLDILTKDNFPSLTKRLQNELAQYDDVYIFGAGHVGLALADCLSLLSLNVSLIDTRADVFAADVLIGAPQNVNTIHAAMPETIVRQAKPESTFIVLTHDHALDFLITREALARQDAHYVGMIGSKTKRTSFERWLNQSGDDNLDVHQLICPIGKTELDDKRPEMIAAQVTSEIICKLPKQKTKSKNRHQADFHKTP